MNFCVVLVVVYRVMFDIVSNARCSNVSRSVMTTVNVESDIQHYSLMQVVLKLVLRFGGVLSDT